MLRYYVYFYFCSAAITAYVGFLQLRFEQMDNGVFPAFEPKDEEGNDELGSTRVKRDTTTTDGEVTMTKQLIQKIEEFRRHYLAMKLRKLKEQGPSEPKFKAPLQKTVTEKRTGTMKRTKRQTEARTQSDREKKKKVRRSKKPKTTEKPDVHEKDNSRDIFISDPNAFFERDEEADIRQGVANQLFVEHWPRTLTYFLLAQLFIFLVLFFGFFTYGYYKYEIWKLKESKIYKAIVRLISASQAAKVEETEGGRRFNAQVDAMAEDALAEDDKRKMGAEQKMAEREEARELQMTAFENVQIIKEARQRRKVAAAQKKQMKKMMKGIRAKGKEVKKSMNKRGKSIGAGGQPGAVQPGVQVLPKAFDPNAAYKGYYPGKQAGGPGVYQFPS